MPDGFGVGDVVLIENTGADNGRTGRILWVERDDDADVLPFFVAFATHDQAWFDGHELVLVSAGQRKDR